MRSKPKVFGIGFHKTGTTSVAEALRTLGYSVTGPNGVDDVDIAAMVRDMAWRLVEQYDAFQDNPWPLLYRELDERYPGSKFILTPRPSEDWIRSVVRHLGGTATPMREWIYGEGDPTGNEALYVSRYERHNREVLEYFKGRTTDLLVLRLTEGEGWDKLCPFLGHQVPQVVFPFTNRASDRERPSFAGRLLRRLLG